MSVILNTSIQGDTMSVDVRVSRLDAAMAREFKAAVDSAWSTGLTRVVIDLGAVEFVDSSGIGALLSVYRKLPSGVGVTRLCRVRPSVLAVLELLRLHRVFEIAA